MQSRYGRRFLVQVEESPGERTVRIPLRVWELDQLRRHELLDDCLVGLVMPRKVVAQLLKSTHGTPLAEPLAAALDGRGDIELTDEEYKLISTCRRSGTTNLLLRLRGGRPLEVKAV